MSDTRAAAGHIQRALRHHRSLAGKLDDLGCQAEKLREICRALASRLSEHGVQDECIDGALADLDRCSRAIRKDHNDAVESADTAAVHVDSAADFLTAIVASK
jgi:hypothetical protein